MTGRNRRASTSSVETVDEDQILWRQEASVLKSVPKLSDSNSWPIFELRDAVVFSKDGQTVENALHVGTRGPFIVRGTLIIDDPSQKQHREAEDGQPLIWVSGKGGWYEIFPSPTYLPIYNKMCEAAVLYYRIMDIYKTQKPKKPKKGKRPDPMRELSHLFHQYSAKIGDGSTLDEVIERCMEHAPFLISQFTQEDPDEFDWRPTLFYSWLTNKHADLLAKAHERLINPPQLPRSPSVEVVPSPVTQTLPSRTRTGLSVPAATRSHPPSQVEAKTSNPRERSTRSHSATQKDDEAIAETIRPRPSRDSPAIETPSAARPAVASPAPGSQGPGTPASVWDDNLTPFETVLKVLEQTYETLDKSRQGMTVLSTLNKIYFNYKFPNYREGGAGSHKIPVEEVLQYNAEDLLQAIDKDKYSKYEIYSWLEEATKREFKPIAIKPSDFPYRLVPRGTRPPRLTKNPEPTPAVQVDGIPVQSLDDDASSTNSGPPSRAGKGPRGRRSGKKSSLRLATGLKKRLHSEIDSDSESEESGPKKSHYFSDDAMDDAGNASSPEDEDAHLSDQEPIKILIRADKIPSTVPHGPHETWTCEEEDCGYVVRGGDKGECQKRIKDHFQGHEEQAKKVNLAMSESRGQLPINHLIDKLKSMSEKSQGGEQISVDSTLHIKRNLYV
ncbi:hypothetical protein G7Z17_g6643 [Cylindrodendrum hubeiense]|uniref:DNA (cytosine-5)-methyltransferase 1 replication foci domain-containing protein n=1 Tax=Cylindrodendrum hubeiense TaxID=595255 RepID=A0A9P5LEY4_9HYPO|nr:hypothetical protein G7Z17_g6643 [Cylindrodendrum hubeiense]